jgi:hypothetical protein
MGDLPLKSRLSFFGDIGAKGGLEDTGAATVDSLRRKQDGLYVQNVYRLNRWRQARDMICSTYSKGTILLAARRISDRNLEASGMLEFNPTEFTHQAAIQP